MDEFIRAQLRLLNEIEVHGSANVKRLALVIQNMESALTAKVTEEVETA